KSREIGRIEFFARCHLPKHRPELRFQLEQAARKEALDRRTGFGEDAAVGRELRTFEREDEIVRRFRRPFAKTVRLLRAIEGGIDLDAGEFAAGIFQFTRLWQPLGIEVAAPGLEYPTSNADPDHARTSPSSFGHGRRECATGGVRRRRSMGCAEYGRWVEFEMT